MAYPNYYNPYINQFTMPYQTPQINNQSNNSVGKMVDGIESVRVCDVPLDGQLHYFPRADGKVVYGKRWLPDCTTQIIEFKADTQNENIDMLTSSYNDVKTQEKVANDVTDLYERFDYIQEKIDNIEKLLSRKNTRAKKEIEDESESNSK